MAAGERQTQRQRRKMPSFSSSLLDEIYHSIDQPTDHQPPLHPVPQRRNAAAQVEEEIESLRRAIMVEKWMENYSATAKARHLPSNSASSTDSSIFTSSETESSASRPTPKPPAQKAAKIEGRFTRTKSRALKIYGDLKKVKEPISPGGRIASFLNSIFSPKKSQNVEEWGSVRKSRSMKDATTCSLASRSCLSKNPNSSRGNNKSKRSVRFCPVSVIVDEHSQPCGHKRIYGGDEQSPINAAMPQVGSQFIKKNIDSFRLYEGKNARKHEFRRFYENEGDFDDKSCASSDLFELENIGAYHEELPVYGTTDLKMNRAIASGLI